MQRRHLILCVVLIAIIVLGLTAFWCAIVQLVTDAGRRMRVVLNSAGSPLLANGHAQTGSASGSATGNASSGSASRPTTRSSYADEEYIVIETSRDRKTS